MPGSLDKQRVVGWRRATTAALLAVFVGIGLSRFAYSPLIPVLIEENWFTPAQAGYLGAANLAGYLLGALVGQRVAVKWNAENVLRGSMLLATAAFFASACPLSFGWFFVWRLASGLAGGTLMVLATPTVLPHVPAENRGLAAGLVFSGVGFGIILSGALIPALVAAGPMLTWCVLGALSLAATACAWPWWPPEAQHAAKTIDPQIAGGDSQPFGKPELVTIYVIYGLVAVGLVPHMVFLVDFVARGLGRGLDTGGQYWVVFGLGALLGPVLAGGLADRIGFARALRWALALQTLCVGLLVFAESPFPLTVSSLFVGGAVSGTVPLVLGRTQEIVSNPRDRKTAWSIATIVFAAGQAGAGYGYSYLFAATGGDYRTLFAIGAGALVVALTLSINAVAMALSREPVT